MEEEVFDLSGMTADSIRVLGREEAPVQQVQEQTTQEPVQQPVQETTQQVTQQETQETQPQKQEPPSYKWKDDFIKQAVEYYEKTGNLTPYLEAKTVDYTAMPDEEIMRRNLRDQYSDLSEKAFDKLFKQQVTDKYKLNADEWDEDESELGRELLRTEANKVRSQYIQQQNQFKAPEPEVDEAISEAVNRFRESVQNSELTKSILDQKKISIKIGEDQFNYELQAPSDIVDMTLDNDKFFTQFADGQGGVDYAKWYKTAAYSQNPEQFERSLINFGKTLGRQEVTKEIKNPSMPLGGDIPTEASGDFISGLLKAFETKGVHK
jgi:hypothetical protein